MIGRFFYNATYYILVAGLIVMGALLLGTRTPLFGDIELKIVRSGSMEPSIPVGSLIMTVPQESYAVNDVITFGADTQQQIPTTHRIVDVVRETGAPMFVTQGDANDTVDPKQVAPQEVIGKVVVHVPSLGYLFDFARQPLGFMLLIAIPASIIILDEAYVIGREFRRMVRKKKGETTIDTEHTSTTPVVQPEVNVPARTAQVVHRPQPSALQQQTPAINRLRPNATVVGDGVVRLYARRSRTA